MKITLTVFVAGVGLGLSGGWFLWRSMPAAPETPAAEIVQADGSRVLERRPQASPKIAHKIPDGGKVERVIAVTVRPKVSGSPATAQPTDERVNPAGGPGLPCPDVHLDMSIVRMPDDSRRVVASSPDGEVIGGIDIPVTPEKPAPKPLKWAAGGYYSPTGGGFGGFIERDIGPFRIGADLGADKQSGRYGIDARARIGIRF